MAATDATERAARLLERLLTDPAFRAEFRREPVRACEEAGLPDVAAELSFGAKALYTLELRESRSSLAGVLMAAAVEGVSAAALLHEAGGAAGHVVHTALSRTGLAAVR